ncbi:MAG: LytR C-terminal domain-containing protein, partial [bacterium]
VNGYDKIKSLDIVSFEKDTKNINVKAINTRTIVADSSLGKNVNTEDSYQLNTLKGKSNSEMLSYFDELLAVKLDYYLIIPMDYFKEVLKLTYGVSFLNDYTADKFAKGTIKITNENIVSYWDSDFANDGQRLVAQNKFLQAFFSKIASVETFFLYSKISEVTKKYIDTNMPISFFRDFINNVTFNSSKTNYGFTPTQIFYNLKEGKIWDRTRFDDYLKNEFSDNKIQREQTRVEVQNASGTVGLATKVSRYISNSGSEVSRVGNFGIEVPRTTVYVKDRNKFAETVNFIENLLKNTEFRFESPEKLSTADILIIVKEF